MSDTSPSNRLSLTAQPVGIAWRRGVLLGLIGLASVYLASLDGEDRGAFGAPLPFGAMLSASVGLIVWFATSSHPRLRWCGYAAIALCFVAVVCSATGWWLWLTEWVPAGYPGHDPAANERVDLWLARADDSYFVALTGAAALVVTSTIGAKRRGVVAKDTRQPSG